MFRLEIVGIVLTPILLIPPGVSGQPAQDEVVHKGKTLEQWTAALKSPDRATRIAAAGAFFALGPKGKPALPALIQALEDDDGLVRYQITQALIKIGQEAVPHLDKASRSSNPTTCFYAKAALDQIAGAKNAKTFEGKLTREDPLDRVRKNMHHKVHPFAMKAGVKYVIDLQSQAFDSYLRLENAAGKQLAQDDDGGGFPHARITFTAPQTGEYRIIVTTYAPRKTGDYTLKIQQFGGD